LIRLHGKYAEAFGFLTVPFADRIKQKVVFFLVDKPEKRSLDILGYIGCYIALE
jgi:hypothetical protein